MSESQLDALIERKLHRKNKGTKITDWVRTIILLGGLVGVKFAPIGETDKIDKDVKQLWSEVKNATLAVGKLETSYATQNIRVEDTTVRVSDHETRIRVLEHAPQSR